MRRFFDWLADFNIRGLMGPRLGERALGEDPGGSWEQTKVEAQEEERRETLDSMRGPASREPDGG